MELQRRTRRLGSDRLGGRLQPLRAPDVDLHVLAAGRQDLLVQQPIPGVDGQVLQHGVFRRERRQDPDQQQRRVGLAGPLVGPADARQQILLVVVEAVALDQPRSGVELHVERAELVLEGGIGQVREHLGVAHDRFGIDVDEIQLDLQPGGRAIGIEPEVVEHQGEDIQTPAYLLAVPRPVLARERGERDVLAHRASRNG